MMTTSVFEDIGSLMSQGKVLLAPWLIVILLLMVPLVQAVFEAATKLRRQLVN